MNNYRFSEWNHPVIGLSPLADAFAGTVYTDVVNMENFERVAFHVYSGGGATGTSLFTVEACDDTVPTTVSAIAFMYREMSSNDVGGTLTAATSAGFTCTAGSNRNILIEVNAQALANLGYSYVRLKAVEQTDSPVTGGVNIYLTEPKSTGSAFTGTTLT